MLLKKEYSLYHHLAVEIVQVGIISVLPPCTFLDHNNLISTDIRKVFVEKKAHIIGALIEDLHQKKKRKENWLVSHLLQGGYHLEAGVMDLILLSVAESRTAPRDLNWSYAL